MEKVITLVSAVPATENKRDDDFADRLSARYTVMMCVVFAVVVSMNQYVGTPITCWAPVHFTGSHIKFANSYCWVRNTYYLPWEESIPSIEQRDEKPHIRYYQWIPFILLGQAFFFYLPSALWHALNSKAGVDADNILETAHSMAVKQDQESRDNTLRMLTNQIDRFLQSRTTTEGCHFDMKSIISATLCRCCGRRIGNYLVLLFLFCKVLYIANVVGQLFILNFVLGMKFNYYGMEVLLNLVAAHDWTEAKTVAFPRVTLCDFNVRRLGNVHPYTVQCVLPINLYNEKIYIILWFWFVFVAFVSVFSLLLWILRSLCNSDRLKFVQNHLKVSGRLEDGRDMELTKPFLDDYLRQDGAFILRLIAHNTNTITTTEVICSLWELWNDKVVKKKRPVSTGSDSVPLEPKSPTGPDLA